MSKRAPLVVVGLLFLALLPRPASAWWETTVTTNSQAMTSQSYVTNGLVAMWDGIENAGWGTHDASATNWVDLIGNGNISFTSTPTFEPDCLVLSRDYESTGVSISGVKSIEICYSLLDDESKNAILSFGTKGTPQFCRYNDYGPGFGYDNGYWPVTLPMADVNVRYCASFVNGGSSLIFQNASLITEKAQRSITGLMYIGLTANEDVAYRGHAEVCNVRLYNRDLTAAEIAANYAVDKQRFIDGWGNNPVITTNRVYHANPPASAYDARSPWNAPDRTRLGGDARTLRPSVIIKEN